jgi:uncharacterized protein YggE
MTGVRILRATVLPVLCCLGAAGYAQGLLPYSPPPATILTEGTATVDALPDYADFWLQRTVTADTVAEAMAAARAFPTAIQDAIEAHELKPDRATASDFSIPEASQGVVKTAVMLRFPVNEYTTADDGPERFAELCDTLQTMATENECKLEGPFFGVNARDTMQEAAIARAIEQALPPAEAAARIMQSRIQTVDHVEILSIAWNRELESRAPQPQIRRVTCTARVKVRYTYVAG